MILLEQTPAPFKRDIGIELDTPLTIINTNGGHNE
jgi:hypothetical protein